MTFIHLNTTIQTSRPNWHFTAPIFFPARKNAQSIFDLDSIISHDNNPPLNFSKSEVTSRKPISAVSVKGIYALGRSLGYDYTTLLKTLQWGKDNTREVIDVNIPRKYINAVVLLFTKKNSNGNVEFVFPNLTNVNVTVEGNPNDIYSAGLAKRDMYREAVRFFGSSTCDKYLGSKCVPRRKYYTDKFACVIDYRTVDDDTVSGSGRKLVGTQVGILMEIEKETTSTDLPWHVFVIADAIIDLMGTKLNGAVQY